MTDQKNFVVTAWYYVPSFVRWPARAATAEDAIAQIQELKQNHADFWDDQEIDGNGATSTNWECFAETGEKMAAIDTTEIAPGGATAMLEKWLDELGEFADRCAESQYTDTDVVWNIMNRLRADLANQLGYSRAEIERLRMLEEDHRLAPIELHIMKRVAKNAVAKGCQVIVNDGEDDVTPALDRLVDLHAAIHDHAGATEETVFRIVEDGRQRGWIHFVHGNGEDLISDIGGRPLIEKICEVPWLDQA